jgi:hypothetical protein
MAQGNRWFTVLKNGGSFHVYVSHNQMVLLIDVPEVYQSLVDPSGTG